MSRLSVYDTLTMLVSGFLWCIMVFPICHCHCHCHWRYEILFWVICYAVGLVYHRILDWFAFEGWDCFRDNEYMIRNSHRKVRKKFREKLKRVSTLESYYETYYYLVDNKRLGSIPILEAQVAFIRDIVPILIVYVIGAFGFEFGIWKELETSLFTRYEIVAFLLFAILLLIVARFVSQYKIYELVWEGSCFINDKEGNKEN